MNGAPFSFVGANAYYLQQLAAHGDTAHVNEVFALAKSKGLRVIRTWGFFDSPDSLNPAVIQFRPGRLNERALRALDFVLHQAELFGIKLILPLVNNWEEFGGMNQYVQWYASSQPGRTKFPQSFTRQNQNKNESARIEGAIGRSYRVSVADGFVHDDFYRIEEIRRWYRSYVGMVLSRVNTYNGRVYKNDPTILMWELANEPRSSERTGELVRSWVAEIAGFAKSIDRNHLIGTGEEGFDISGAGYQTAEQYGGQAWLFDGTAGISFSKNLQDPNIDVASIHLYSDTWKIGAENGSLWIVDHAEISRRLGKPLILGEFGIQTKKSLVYRAWLNTIVNSAASGGLVWQLVYEGRNDVDGYSISCSRDPLVCDVLSSSGRLLSERDVGLLQPPTRTNLAQNFPNPFNETTVIEYEIGSEGHAQLEIFNELGQRVTTLFEGWEPRGRYVMLFEGKGLASGVYFYRLTTGKFMETKKFLYLK